MKIDIGSRWVPTKNAGAKDGDEVRVLHRARRNIAIQHKVSGRRTIIMEQDFLARYVPAPAASSQSRPTERDNDVSEAAVQLRDLFFAFDSTPAQETKQKLAELCAMLGNTVHYIAGYGSNTPAPIHVEHLLKNELSTCTCLECDESEDGVTWQTFLRSFSSTTQEELQAVEGDKE